MYKNDWLVVNDIMRRFNLSESTVRRWVERHKTNRLFVIKDKNRYLINLAEFARFYNAKNEDYSDYSNDQSHDKKNNKENSQDFINNNEKLALMTLSKQANDISQALLQQNKHKIYRHSSFWILIILIILLLVAGYYCTQKLQSIYSTQLRQLQSTHSTKVIELKEELQETRTAYHSAINRIDLLHEEYNDKLEDKEKTHKAELTQEREKLQQLQQELNKKSQPQSFGTTE